MYEQHHSSLSAAQALESYLLDKLSGSVQMGEKCGLPILFSIKHVQDIAPIRVASPKRFVELGFCKGMESKLWSDYRERHNRQAYLIGQDEQDYSRQLIDRFDDVRVGDFSNIDASPTEEEEEFLTDSFGFKNEKLTTDEELVKTFAGAQEAHINKIRQRIERAGRKQITSGPRKGAYTGTICSTKLSSADFNFEEEKANIRAELELVYRKLQNASMEDGQEPEDWLDSLWDQIETLKQRNWKKYSAAQKLHDKYAVLLGRDMDPARLHHIKGVLLDCVMNAESSKKAALRFDGILNVIENEMMEIARGGIEDQTHEFGAMYRDVHDRFEHQFATREGGLREIDDRVIAKKYAPNAESDYVFQHLGYGIEDFAENF